MTGGREALPALVSTEWLSTRLGRPGLRVLDGSWYMPAGGRDAAAEYIAAHVPGALFFDLDATSDTASPLPHMLPAAAAFARRMGALGLGDDDDLVVYDGSGANLSAARAWWTFKVFGHARAAVLDGSLGKWRREGRPVESGSVALPTARFTARLDPDAVRDLEAMRANLVNPVEQIVDMRPAGRFAGTDPEPRPGLRGGHIPGSRSLPYTELVAADGTMLSPEALHAQLAAAGIDPDRAIVATCGSGTSACALVLALHVLGRESAAVYDGSWSEWGGRQDTAVSRGTA
ncbi:MAG: 3-mercaptopyruvate sulfurtransferase [Gemmatimonadales bacterium]